LVLLWSTPHGINGLVLHLTRNVAGDVRAESLELAPSDIATLMLRCGPDVDLLRTKHAPCSVLVLSGLTWRLHLQRPASASSA
jgi:hypothetical protein